MHVRPWREKHGLRGPLCDCVRAGVGRPPQSAVDVGAVRSSSGSAALLAQGSLAAISALASVGAPPVAQLTVQVLVLEPQAPDWKTLWVAVIPVLQGLDPLTK